MSIPGADHCAQCGTLFRWLSPTPNHTARLYCDCQWRAQLRLVAEDLLPLLDHPAAFREARRRQGLNRHLRGGQAA